MLSIRKYPSRKSKTNLSSFIICDRTNITELVYGPSSPDKTHKSNVGAIAGGVVGGCLLLLATGLTLCYYRHRRHIAPEITPFHIPTAPVLPRRTPTLASNSEYLPHDTPHTPLHKSPPATDIASLHSPSSTPATVVSEWSSLRDQVINLRVELDALRSRKLFNTTSHTTQHPPPSVMARLRNEIVLLREELTQIKTRLERDQTAARPSIPPINEDLRGEVASLRAELEAMRSQQSFAQLGDLPRYSPPPANNAFVSGFPSFAGVQTYLR